MKKTNFEKILELFDYAKSAYLINKEHKNLYKPLILFILLKGFLLCITLIASTNSIAKIIYLTSMEQSKWFSVIANEFLGLPLIFLIVTLLSLIIGSTYVEAGLYHMYACYCQNPDDSPNFYYGAGKYFFPFLGGNLLIVIAWFFALIPYFIASIITLSLGFTLIPVIVSAFLLVWKCSLVTKDRSIFNVFKDSFAFGKKHFVAALIFIMISGCFLSPAVSRSAGNGNFNFNNSWDTGSNIDNFDSTDDFDIRSIPEFNGPLINNDKSIFADTEPVTIVKIIGTIISILITLMVLSSNFIKMIFQVFFGLVIMLLYLDDWGTNNKQDISGEEEIECPNLNC